MGEAAATAVVSTIAVVVNLLIVYIVIMQFFKIMKGIENKNSADGGERAQAMTQIKNAIIVVVLVVVVGGVGFNALLFLGGSVQPPDPDSQVAFSI
jgi:ABC-type sugar transport system permease subunit